MRKVWFPAALVVVLIVVTIAYIRLVLVMSQNRPAYDALPESSAVIFEFNHPDESFGKLSDSQFNPYLKEAPFFKKLLAQLAGIDSFVKAGAADTSFKTWSDSKLLAGMSITGRDEFDYLYVLKKKRLTKDRFQKIVINAEVPLTINKRPFRDETIYETSAVGAGRMLSFAFVNGLFIASYVPALVEQSLAQLRDNKSLSEDKGFSEINELAGDDADMVTYLNLANLGKYESLLVNDEQADLFQAVNRFGKWMELDIKVKDNSFMINGYTSMGDKKSYLAAFTREPETQVEITRVMPYSTALFFYNAVDDFLSYLKHNGKSFSPQMDNFQNWISNEWCFGLLEPLDEHYEDDAFLVVRAVDPEIATLSLAERARLSGDDLNLAEFKEYPIGQLSLKNDLNDLLGHHFLKISQPYYTVIDNYVVFANNITVIKTILQNYEEGQTMHSDPDYMVFERNLTTASNFYIYFNTARSVELLNKLLSNALLSDIRKGSKNFVRFSPVALQFNHYQDIFFTNGYIQFSSSLQAEDRSNRFWQVKLDATPMGTPSFVINHYTNEKEIIVQDSLNNIYLITKNGRILWKRQLDSPILSEIYLIDFFENTKLQYAFNTKGKIYIIDRKGDNVADYPVKLAADATNGMLLIDYDKNKDYRMFVACNNGNIYGYYKSGKQLPGWNPKSKMGIVKFPLKYVAMEGKDFLIAANDKGEVHLLNRKGERRSKTVELGKSFPTDFQLRTSKNNFQLINVDKDGMVYKVYRNGSFSSQKQDALPRSFFDFIYTDLNGDGNFEMIFVDSLVAKVYNEKFVEVASPSFSEKISKAFLINEGGQRGIGFLSQNGRKIYYTDSNYNLLPGFPLESCTPFIVGDLFETGRRAVIAGDCEGWVNAYQVK